jgi:hypothetical protein
MHMHSSSSSTQWPPCPTMCRGFMSAPPTMAPSNLLSRALSRMMASSSTALPTLLPPLAPPPVPALLPWRSTAATLPSTMLNLSSNSWINLREGGGGWGQVSDACPVPGHSERAMDVRYDSNSSLLCSSASQPQLPCCRRQAHVMGSIAMPDQCFQVHCPGPASCPWSCSPVVAVHRGQRVVPLSDELHLGVHQGLKLAQPAAHLAVGFGGAGAAADGRLLVRLLRGHLLLRHLHAMLVVLLLVVLLHLHLLAGGALVVLIRGQGGWHGACA